MTINGTINFLSKKSTGNILAILVVVIFLALALVRLYPYENNLQTYLKTETGNDWLAYTEFGLDIARNGILLPAVASSYNVPAGFLYNYFVALCFIIFGESLIPIYIIQHIMMGLAVALIYWTFRDKMNGLTGIMFLGVIFIFTLLDAGKYYVVRVLSENLMFFTISLFFFCFIRGIEKKNIKLQLFSAFLMGTIVLTRPETILFAAALILVVSLFYFQKRLKGFTYLVLFITIMALGMSFLGIRNRLACGEWEFLPKGKGAFRQQGYPIPPSIDLSKIDTNPLYARLNIGSNISPYLEYMRQEPLLFFEYLFKKVLFSFGFLSILVPYFRWRPHWTLMWIGYFIYLFLRIRERKKFEMWEIVVHVYILCHMSILILYTNIGSYGFRRFISVTNFVLLFSFLALDKVRKRFSNGSPHAKKTQNAGYFYRTKITLIEYYNKKAQAR